MNSNILLLLLLSLICLYLIKDNKNYRLGIFILIIIGYIITNKIIISFSLAIILVYLFTFFKKDLNIDSFKNIKHINNKSKNNFKYLTRKQIILLNKDTKNIINTERKFINKFQDI